MGPVEPTRSNAAHRDLPTWINVMEAPHEPLGGPLDLALAGGGSTEQTHAGRCVPHERRSGGVGG